MKLNMTNLWLLRSLLVAYVQFSYFTNLPFITWSYEDIMLNSTLSVLHLRWIVLLCDLLKSSGFNLFIPVILPPFHYPRVTLRYPPNCLQTHTLQLHRVLTN